MELPIEFPDEREKMFQAAEAFRRLSTDEKIDEIFDLMTLGAFVLAESPRREVMKKLQQEQEDAWQKAQRELFARHGL
jgi:hypothetical protein